MLFSASVHVSRKETQMATTQEELTELERLWAEAEIAADVSALDVLATREFTLVGRRDSCLAGSNGSTAIASATSSPDGCRWKTVQLGSTGTPP
jgi:hypothetical protein